MSGVEVSLSVDLTGLLRRLSDAEVDILNGHADATVTEIKKQWDGWLYANIPKDYQTGRSNVAWRRGRTQSTEGLRSVEIINDAQHKDRTYAAFVHRTGSSVLELDVVLDTIVRPGVPLLVRALTEAVATANIPSEPKKLRRGTPGPRKTRSLSV
jgi:hypothetical protein